jgi:predicted RNase H-like HicB family nuclease
MTKIRIRVIIEEHDDGFLGYPVVIRGTVVGQGETHADALKDTLSAIRFHLETFGLQELVTAA